MKIGILTGAFLSIPPYDSGAVETRWLQMAKVLALHGHDVCLIYKAGDALEVSTTKEGLKLSPLRGYSRPHINIFQTILDGIYSTKALWHLLDREIVISNTFWYPFLSKTLKLQRAPLIVNVARRPKGQYFLYRRVELFLCTSKATLRQLIAQAPHVSTVSSILNNPVDTNIFFNREQDATQQTSVLRLLYAGRIHRDKGVELAINSFKACIDQGAKATLTLIGPWLETKGGSGPLFYEKLCRTIEGYPIEFLGPIDNKEKLADQYRRSDAFLYLSYDPGETFGVAPLEAMACGSVPLVSNQECFKDFLDHECAYFYENEQNNVMACTNWMFNILKDRESLRLKRAQGLCRAKLFSVDAIVNQLEQRLRALLKQ